MNIGTYLQNLQNYLNHVFNIQPQTSAPIIISLTIFILGFLFTELLKGLTRINKRKIIKKIFFECLSNLTIELSKQSKAYFSFSKNTRFRSAEEGGILAIQKGELHLISIIKQIGYDKLFAAFFTGFYNSILLRPWQTKRIKAFNKIWACLEIAISWQNTNESQSNLIMDKFNEANTKREKALHQYFEFLMPEILKTRQNTLIQETVYGKYLLEIVKIKYDWENSSQSTNPSNLNRLFVLPAMKIDNKYKMTLNDSGLENLIKSSILLQESLSNFQQMERLLKNLKDISFLQGIHYKTYVRLIVIAKNKM